MATTTMGTPGRRMNTTIIYWVIAIVVVLGAAWFLSSRYGNRSEQVPPVENQGVMTEPRSGEMGSSGAASQPEATDAPARTNDTNQR